MLDWIIGADTWLFLQLNAGVANGFFDWLMPIATESRNLRWLMVPSLVMLALFGSGKGRGVVLTALILLGLTDLVSSQMLKPWIGRLRPCHVVDGARVIYRCGGTFSFPSSHAVNSMGAAIFFGLMYRRWIGVLVGVSVLNSYSRIYLGIHYPFDMLAGWALGGGMGWGMAWLYRTHLQRLLGRWRVFGVKRPPAEPNPCPERDQSAT